MIIDMNFDEVELVINTKDIVYYKDKFDISHVLSVLYDAKQMDYRLLNLESMILYDTIFEDMDEVKAFLTAELRTIVKVVRHDNIKLSLKENK